MKWYNSNYLVIICWLIHFLLPTTLFSQLSWQQTNSEIDYPVYKFVGHNDNLYAAFYGAGVYKTADEGDNWIACHNGLSNFLARDIAVSENTLFVGTNKGGVFKSLDNGESWQTANDTLLHKNIWSLLAANKRLFAGTSSGLFFTDDEGNSWQKAALPPPEAHHQIIFSLGIKGSHILAGSNSNIYLSEDFGETWEQIKVPTNLDIMTIQVHPDSNTGGSWLLGTSGDGILSSADGKNWTAFNKEAGNTRSLILVDNTLVLGLAVGGVVNMGADQTQNSINEGFANPSIRSLGYHNDKLYAGTYEQGIWRYDIPKGDFIPPVTSSRHPESFREEDLNIFPNPTTDGLITLEYQLEERANTHIELLDVYGKKIAQIFPLTEQYKGVYQTSYDMNGLSGGTYFFHLQIGDRKITKPIIFIKN